MNQNLLQIAVTNNTDIIGYHTAEETPAGLALVGNDVRVNLSITINGLNFEIKTESKVPLDIFQTLKAGTFNATVGLAPFSESVESAKKRENTAKPVPKPLTSESYYEPKRQSAFNTRLGTSGKKKFFKKDDEDIEVSWVDIVELAHKKCGSKSNLQTLYQWAEQNVYTIINGRKCSIRELNNWEASIRQNRRRAIKNLEKAPIQPESIPEDAQGINAELDIVYAEENFCHDQANTGVFSLGDTMIDTTEYLKMDHEQMVDSLQDYIKSSAEEFEQTKIPMKICKDEPMPLPCRIPNPYSMTEPTVEFDFYATL